MNKSGYYQANKERVSANYKRFMEKNPDYWKKYCSTEEYRAKKGLKKPYKGRTPMTQEERAKRRRQYAQTYYLKHPERRKNDLEAMKRWRKNNPDYFKNRMKENPEEYQKYIARQRLNNAITKGEIVRQFCEVINCKNIGEAHHDDYSKPLDVKWLCKAHHEEYHKKVLA